MWYIMMAMIVGKLKRGLWHGALLATLFVASWVGVAHASTYGTGNYGACDYNCPAPPTVVSTPSGLQVSINLTNGQVIPASGYTIIVTPLNGQGATFQSAAFYIDGTLVQTVTPAETGTATWLWNPQQYPGTDIKVVVTGTDGTTISQEFTVTIASSSAAPTTSPTGTSAQSASPSKSRSVVASIGAAVSSAVTSVPRALQHLYNGAKRIVQALPKPVVYALPYFLFVILGVNVLLLLLQTKRELASYRTLQALIERSRAVAEAKEDLSSLVAHYLRTPLTVILGGIDLLQQGEVVSSTVLDVRAVANRMRSKIEELIATTTAIANSDEVGPPPTSSRWEAVWRRIGPFVPVAFIAFLVVMINILAQDSGKLSLGQGNLIVQFAIFVSLLLVAYQAVRRTQLRRRDKRALERILRQEDEAASARDAIIANTVTALRDDLQQLDLSLGGLTNPSATGFIANGRERFQEVLSKFALAQQLRGGRSPQPFQTVTMQDLFARATQDLRAKAAAQQLTLNLASPEIAVETQDVGLLTIVLRSLIDNAIAYSPASGAIEVSAQKLPDGGASIAVVDHGQGVPKDKLPLLFQGFAKAEGTERFTHEGMGFSLYLDRIIMTYLGGTIAIDSREGNGTTAALKLSPSAPAVAA